MMVQRVAQILGWIFVAIAIWGAVVAGTTMEADPALAPALWGLFPVNFIHNLVHLLFGIWGIRAARSLDDARTFAVVAGIAYIVLAVTGLFAPDGFGALPLGGNDLWLHAILGCGLFVTGVIASTTALDPPLEPGRTRTVLPPTSASTPEGTITRPIGDPVPPEAPAPPTEAEPAGREPDEAERSTKSEP